MGGNCTNPCLPMRSLTNLNEFPIRHRRRREKIPSDRMIASIALLAGLMTTMSWAPVASFIICPRPQGQKSSNFRTCCAPNPSYLHPRRPAITGACSSASTTALRGVRSSIRNQLLRFKRGAKPVENASSTTSAAAGLPLDSTILQTVSPVVAVESLRPEPVGVVALSSAQPAPMVERMGDASLGTTTAVLYAPPRQLHGSTESLYSLPPVPEDRRLTKLEVEFRDLLEHFTNYTESDLLSLRDPRMRTLFRGVAASAVEPPVYRAFEVLYEDLYPLRLAVAFVVNETGLAGDDVEATRLAFVSVAAELNGDAYLTRNQLERIDVLTDVAVNILNYEYVEDLLDRLEQYSHSISVSDSKHHSHRHPHGKLSFTDLIVGLQRCAEEMCGLEACNPAAVMQHIMLDLKSHPPTAVNAALDEKRRKFSDRYDEMLTQFMEWEEIMPDGDGRRMDVVKGCFVGARNQPVVDALRIVYVDFSPLRVAGDIIFKLVSGVMRARQHRKHHEHD
jgi:hypothetical protein